jgi:predicted GTPase
LNALAGFDRALVHPLPGTTRDVVDAMVEWSGVPVRLVDTVGGARALASGHLQPETDNQRVPGRTAAAALGRLRPAKDSRPARRRTS